MSAKRTIIAAATAAAMITSITACSSGSSSSNKGSGGSFSAADVNLDTLLPANTQLSFAEVGVLWAPLVTFNSDGSLKYIQASAITGSNDSRVWTIKLRPGWTFHNGEPVTAQSYADGWNLTAYGPNANSNSGVLANIVGYPELNPKSGKPTVTTLSGLKVLDTNTLQVSLAKPDSQFPLELGPGQVGFYPMPKAGLANPASFKTEPIGDGPYQMDGSAKLNEYVKMKAYPNYQGPNKAHIAHLTFKLYSSPDTAYTDVQAGNVDIDIVPQDKFPQIKADFGSRIVQASGASIEYLGFPLFDQRFQKIELRQAISLSIDRAAINKAIFGGLYEPADSLFAPAMIGGSTHSCQYCKLDAARAKQLLAAAGGWTGPMVIPYPGGAGYDQAFLAVANQIRQNLGIDAKAQPSVGFSDYFSNLAAKKYTGGPYRGKWGSAYPSPADTLNQLFTPAGAFNNATGFYSNPKVTALIAQGNAAPSLNAAIASYQQAERTITADFPVVPMFWETFPFVYSTRITHVQSRPSLIDIDWESVDLK